MPPPRDVKKQQSLADDEKRVVNDRYRIEKKLGHGNFGTAFLVTDLKENNELKVLKEVTVGDMQSDESVESVQEARLLAKLDNPHILKYYDSFLDGEYFCILTEYCEGGDLDQRFKKNKKDNIRLSEEQVLDWTIQLLSAVNYMHSRRVLHRDLKARNIFLRQEAVKIGDFGISRILQGTMDMAQTFTGTPYYMSPEVLKHEGYNSKSDVWSIGCLLYEMCTYEHAFQGQGLMGVMYKIVEGIPPELPKTYSRELNSILKKIFIKDPNQRPSSTELLREPYIIEHIKCMIKRLELNKIDQMDSTLVIRNDRNEIARALSAKVSLRDLQNQGQPTLPKISESSVSKANKVTSTPVGAGGARAAAMKPTAVTKQVGQQAGGGKAAASNAKSAQKQPSDDYDDDDDVRSNFNEPVGGAAQKPKPSSELPTPSVQAQATSNGPKELTPKERMLLNKMKKADEVGAKLGQVAKENYEERMLRETFRREATIHGSTSIWKPPTHDNSYDSNNILQKSIRDINYENTLHYEQQKQQAQYYKDDFENEEGTLLKTLQNYPNSYQQQQQVTNYRGSTNDIPDYATNATGNNGDRPIRPMKSTVEFDRAFDEDGIPLDPQITNDYYNNFNDFEIDSSPERKPNMNTLTNRSVTRASMSKTIAPRRRVTTAGVVRKPLTNKYLTTTSSTNNTSSSNAVAQQLQHQSSAQFASTSGGGAAAGGAATRRSSRSDLAASKTYSGIQPRYSKAAQLEYEQLIALSNARADRTETFGDDSKTGIYGTNVRAVKIQNLKAQAMRMLGVETFEKCYSYLKEMRHGPNAGNVEENKIFEGLKQFTPNPGDCFVVDQLVFLEGQ